MFCQSHLSLERKGAVVRAGDMGTIPHKHRAELRSGIHRFNHDLARAGSAPGSWDGSVTAAQCLFQYIVPSLAFLGDQVCTLSLAILGL